MILHRSLEYCAVWILSGFVGMALSLAMASTASAQVQCFNNRGVWLTQVSQVETLTTTASGVAQANEVNSPPGSNTSLGSTLTWDAANTSLSRTFVLRALENNAQLVFYDTEFLFPDLPDNSLSIGDINNQENDDFEFSFTSGPPLYGFGFDLLDNDSSAGENLRVFSTSGSQIGSCSSIIVNSNVLFVGVVSDEPIGKIDFNEDPGGDDIAIRDFIFASRPGDVSVTKDDGQTTAIPGDSLTYVIQVRNNGAIRADSVGVNDTFQAPLSGCTWNCSASGGASCTASGSGNLAESVDLPSGSSVSFSATCGSDLSADGAHVNTVSLTLPDGFDDTNTSNNSASDSTSFVPETDLSLGKDDGVTEIDADDDITYTLTINNLGPLDSTGGTVVDTLPSGFTFVSSASGCSSGGSTVTCPFGALTNGSSTSLSFVAHVDASLNGTVTNSATVTGNELDPDNGNDMSSHSVEVVAQADLALSKLDTPDPVVAGAQLTYRLTVTNNGPSDSTGGLVSDTLPNDLTFASSSDCVDAGSTVDCVVGNLASGSSQILEFIVDVDPDASGNVTNTATVSGNDEDPVNGNNSASAVTEIIRQADLETVKQDLSGGAVTAGEAIDYTITVTNLGPNDVVSAVVSDTFPTALDDVSWTCTASPGSSCDAVGSGNINDAVNLLAGGSVTYTVQALVESDVVGSMINQASASNPSGTEDPDPSNDFSAVTTMVIREADLRLAKEDASGGETVPGGTLSYRLIVTNDGPSDSSGGTVSDTLPSGTTFRGSASGCSALGSIVTCPFATLMAGSQRTLIFTVDVDPSASGVLTNTATVSGDDPDPDSSNNEVAHDTLATPRTDLEIVKRGPSMASPGQSLTYSFEVTNFGPSDSTGSSVQDVLPPGLSFVSSPQCSSSGGTVTCPTGPLAANASTVLSLIVQVDASVTTAIFNTATVTSNEEDPVGGNNTSTARTTVDRMVDLALQKFGDTSALAGGSLSYTLIVSNMGPADASGGSVLDTLPTGLSFESSSHGCSGVTGGVVCPFGSLPSGQAVDLIFTARVAPDASGTLTNQAMVFGNENDPVASNNSATLQTTISRSTDLALSKDDGVDSVTPGEELLYVLTVQNLGPSDSSGAQITDPLPGGLTFVSSEDGCSPSGTTVSCPVPALAANSSTQVSFRVAVASSVTSGINNTANLSANETDPQPANSQASHGTALAIEADLGLSKDDGVVQGVAGSQLTYTLTVNNAGPSSSSGGIVLDPLPAGLTFASSADGCSDLTGTVQCPFGPIAVGVSLPMSFVVDVAADFQGTVINAATVEGTDDDLNPANDMASHPTPIVRQADLALSKDDSVTSAAPGDELTYTLTVTNLGPSDSSGAQITDVLPLGLAFLGSSSGCTTIDGVLSCNVSPLAAGASASLQFDVRIGSELVGSVVNSAQVDASDADPVLANNGATHLTSLSGRADLAITKTDDLDVTAPGATHFYTVTVSNLGPSDETAATVTDTLPSQLVGVTWSCQPSPGSQCTNNGVGDLVDTAQILAGGVLVYTVRSTVDGTVGGQLSNTATVSGSLPDGNLGDNSSTDLTDLQAIADLRLSKDDGQTAVQPGAQLTYTLTVDNLGPSDVLGATLSDVFPPALSQVAWTCQPEAGATCNANGFGDLNESIDLPSGARVVFSATATVAADAAGLLLNSATVTLPPGVLDPDLDNNSDMDVDTLDPTADLLLLKTDHQDTVAPGDLVTYDLTVRNLGPGDAAGAQVIDLLPQTLLNATWTCTPSGSALCTASGSGHVIDSIVLPAGDELLYRVSALVDPDTLASGLLNTASVSPPPGLDDPAPSNNSATDINSLERRTDLRISKTDGLLQVVPGQSLTYTVQVTNLGPSHAQGPQVHDPLPDGLSCVWTCTAGVGASCLSGQSSGDLLDFPFLPAGAAAIYTGFCNLVADFDSSLTAGQLINQVTVSAAVGAVDPQPLDNSAVDIDSLTPLADLGVSKSDGVTSAVPGQTTLNYIISAQNAGPSNVIGATLSDVFPNGLECLWSCVPGPGATCTAGQHLGDIATTVNLAPGSSLAINAQCQVDSHLTGTLVNTVSIQPPPGTTDPNPNNNQASDVDTTLQPTVQVSVAKSDGLDSLAPGESLTYTVVLNNHGPSDAPGITFSDTLPSQLSNVTWSCDASGGALCNPLGGGDIVQQVSLPPGSKLTYLIDATVRPDAAAGPMINTAAVSLPAGLIDSLPEDNSASDLTELTPQVSLAISKTNGVDHVVPGTSVTYTLSVTNDGPSDALDARVVDDLPDALTAVSWGCQPSPGASCTLLGSGDLDDTVRLPVGSQLVYTIDATVAADAAEESADGLLTNTATVTPAPGVLDLDLSDNTASDSDSLTPEADLHLTKSDGLSSVVPGSGLTYVIDLRNDGPSSAVGVTLQDLFPAGLSCNWTCQVTDAGFGGTAPAACGQSGPTSDDLLDTANLPVGALLTYTATCQVDAAASGSVLNTATVSLPEGLVDPDLSDNSASDLTVLEGRADLVISKSDGRNTVGAVETLTYTLVVSNPFGPSAVFGATVTDAFPSDLSCVWGCQGVFGATCTPGQVSGDLFDVVDLPVGSQAVYTALCDIAPQAVGSIVNAASVQIPAGVVDSNPSNNVAQDVTEIDATVDFAITVNDGRLGAIPGDSLTYIIEARQLRGPPMANVRIRDAFPPALDCLWTCQGLGGGSCAAGQHSGDLIDDVQLATGARVRYTAVCDIEADAHHTLNNGTLSNTATVEPPDGVLDINPADNSQSDLDTVLQPTADLSITKTDGATLVLPGAELTYDIVVRNVAGPSAALGVTVEDLFPSTLDCRWTCNTSGDGSCTAGPVDGDLLDLVNLYPGDLLTYTAVCDLAESAAGNLENRASLHLPEGFDDPVPSNNSSLDETAIQQITDLSLTLDDGTSSAVPGAGINYQLQVDNVDSVVGVAPGVFVLVFAQPVRGLIVRDTLPGGLTCSWTCEASLGSQCSGGTQTGDLLDTADLAAGGQLLYSASCAIDPASVGVLANSASLILPAGLVDIDLSNNQDTAQALLTPTAQLSLSKTDHRTSIAPGSALVYELRAANLIGPSDAPGARVIDLFPTTTGCLWSCQASGGGFCPPGLKAGDIDQSIDLPVGAEVLFTAQCQIAAAASGMLSNTANLVPPISVDDPDLGDNTASDLDTALIPTADLILTKSDGVTQAAPGDTIAYTLLARNVGPSAMLGVHLLDDLPDSLSCTWTCGSLGGAICDPTPPDGDLSTFIDLTAGGSVVFNAACQIDPAARGLLTNQASLGVGPGALDPDLDNNTAIDADTVLVPRADLVLQLTNGMDEVVPGTSVNYTLRLDNEGPSHVFDSQVTTHEAPEMQCLWTCQPDAGSSCLATPQAGPLDDLVDLPPQAGATYIGTCQVASSAVGTLAMSASVTPPTDTEDPELLNNTASDHDQLTPRADLSLTKDDGVDQVAAGDSLTYTLSVHNAGPSDAPGAIVSDFLPPELTCSWSCTTTGGAVCLAGVIQGDLFDTLHLPAAASVIYTGTCQVDPSSDGTLVNSATVATPATVDDPQPGNNSDDDSNILERQADLSISKDDGQVTVLPGESVVYEIRVDNLGPSDAPEVTVEDLFSADLDCTWTCQNPELGCTAGPTEGDLNDSLGLEAGDHVTYFATCAIAESALTSITNTASVAVTDAFDPQPDNNIATDIDVVGNVADLEILVVDEPDPVAPGDVLAYGVEVHNRGPAAASNIEVVGLLPDQVTYLGLSNGEPGALFFDGFETGDVARWDNATSSGSQSSGAVEEFGGTVSCDEASGNLTCQLGTLASGGRREMVILVRVDDDADGVLIHTLSVASAGTDPDSSNDTATAITAVAAGDDAEASPIAQVDTPYRPMAGGARGPTRTLDPATGSRR